jgi:uncharacterized membrane protein
MNRALLVSALAAAISLPGIAAVQAGPATEPSYTAEKCYGLAKAGQNDCASTGNHSCAATSKIDGDPASWIFVPAGYCERIVGGHLEAMAAM